MQKIGIVNQKGGCSKTTTSMLITLALSSLNKKVLLIDADPQGGVTAFVGISGIVNSLFEAMLGEDIRKCICTVENPQYKFISACHNLDKVSTTINPFIFSNMLESIENLFDVIVIDTPPTMQGITRAAAMYADRIIVPSMVSKADLLPTLYTIDELKSIDKKPEVVLIGYREPKEGQGGYNAKISREFMNVIGKYIIGTLPKKIGIVSAISDKNFKWTPVKCQNILEPVIKTLRLDE